MASSSSPLIRPNNPHHQSYDSIVTPSAIAEEELTEEELAEYERGIISWSRATRHDFWFRREWFWGYIVSIALIILVTLMTIFHHRIIEWLMPFVRGLQKLKYGWLMPIGLIFLLSFPPLFGNEIVILLVGVVWGLKWGTCIVAAGVILGESATFGMFKSCCRGRAERMTRKDLNYACLSEAIMQGGFLMAWIVRLSVIPTHFSTAVFAVCGLQYWQFLAALLLGLPKQIIAVYAGSVLAAQHPSTSSKAISNTVFVVGAIMTVFALRFIYRRMTAVRKMVLLTMRDDLRSKGIDAPRRNRADTESDMSQDTVRP